MKSNRYIMLLVSVFAYLFVFIITLASLSMEIGAIPGAYFLTFTLIFTVFPLMAISITSYLLGRAIFTSDKVTVNKKLLVSFLLFIYSISAILSYEIAVNYGDMTNWQYVTNSILILSVFVALPMWLARPNKLLLKLTAQFHKGF